ncbi:hypothetical protein AVEN_262827-1 [Araneus ventricosus]|uniref:Uncharacterized protein n=1 Tax=Araneus ventricosus TaxID=182803 RepID=A0A4Y2QMU6_ARAVE|nr:hypothetical protein AVEN_257741-1 [Araneus ventricosus]GBN64652.1 hypothetical protein AVEN_238253-1 [Araneus ventricosus]GBN64663.1 hypothetical protein AVEN_23203-1 [Araneus ventricosus]GBN64686.1 hypothetical protein AVEN_262827-1 [Araneus ventricosus]
MKFGTCPYCYHCRSFPNRGKARFALLDAEDDPCNVTQHRMNHPPMKQYPRLLPLAKKQEAERLYKEMVDNGIIEETSGPWASHILWIDTIPS